jgi:hypothetical protein
MNANIGRKIRKMFFVDDTKQTTDYYEGTVHSVTDNNLYYVIYSDNDSETITQAEFSRNIANQCPSRPVLTPANIMVTITVAIARLNATILGVITLQLIIQVLYAQLLPFVDRITHTTHPLSSLPLLKI